MPTCPACAAEITSGSRFCGACGAEVHASAATVTRAVRNATTSTSSLDQARFTAGTLLAGRYRIVGLLGRGGMGEVYRAEDLKLDQPVALKFLPVAMERDDVRLARLLSEVRLARQVSHPNVCRVYDIDEIDGSHVMAMEYVDGEDLASLLRRIGRLPQEKALEIARQICAGLAAAHEQGILHRDLKPANIMIDGRGRVKLADFGLADLAVGLEGEETRSGTPAYMAPEQLAGREVTVRSDVYALGLVLYEIFTGESVYHGMSLEEIARHHDQSAPTEPSSLVSGLDDTVERVILRCLEKEAAARPATALAVTAALPGGDPLAAALAAGETPSPEMVAEAGAAGGLKPTLAWSLLIGFLVLLGLNIAGLERFSPVGRADLPKSAGVLKEKARETLVSLGYDRPPGDSVIDFDFNDDYLRYLRNRDSVGERLPLLERDQPAAIHFGYLQSPEWLVYKNNGAVRGWITRSTAPVPGEVRLKLDPAGRLVWLEVTLPDSVGTIPVPAAADWTALLAAAGLDRELLDEVEPEWLPPGGFGERRAWTGTYPDSPEGPIRIEAASLLGLPVSFRIIEPWTQPLVVGQAPLIGPGSFEGLGAILAPILWAGTLCTIGILAWRNLRRGRGDRRTAVRFAFALAAVRMSWYVFGHHVPTNEETNTLAAHLAWTLYRFGLAYAFYVALEPYARKLWPHMLTSWVRLFDNRLRDPLVGRDILVGMTLAAVASCMRWLTLAVFEGLGLRSSDLGLSSFSLEALRGIPGAFMAFFGVASQTAFTIFITVTVIFLMRLAMRRDGLTLIPLTLLVVLFNLTAHPLTLVTSVVFALLVWIALFRFGLLCFVVFMVTQELMQGLPLTFDLGAWYAAATWITLTALLTAAVWTFRNSLAGRPVFRDGIIDD